MTSEEQRCAEAKAFARIDAAFRAGDLDALRAAVDDPDAIPNGVMPLTIRRAAAGGRRRDAPRCRRRPRASYADG